MAGIPNQNPYQPPMPTGSQRPNYPQPVVYRPGQPGVMPTGAMPPDAYRPGMPPTGPQQPGMPGAPTSQPQDNYEYVAKKDVAFGILGAGAGFFLGPMIGLTGPIGAIILGIALLAISSIGRAVKNNKAKKDAQQQLPPNQMPQAPQYPDPRMQQQPGQQFQNQYNYQMNPNQMQQQDPRYRYPQQ